jgi:hypothetical protein
MGVLIWSLWGATVFLLIVFWSIEFQLISDLKTLPRARTRRRAGAVHFPCRSFDPIASHIHLNARRTSRAPGITFQHTVYANAPELGPGQLNRADFKAPALKKLPLPTKSDCLFDRRGARPDLYHTTRLSWLTHGYGLSPLGPAPGDVYEEDFVFTEMVCEELYDQENNKARLVPYRADLQGMYDPLHCTERLEREHKTWAGFYCQVHPSALLDTCPSLEYAKEKSKECIMKGYKPPIRPGCCEKIFSGDSFFRMQYDLLNTTNNSYAFVIFKNDSTSSNTGDDLYLKFEKTSISLSNTSLENYTDTFTLAPRYDGSKNSQFLLRANLIPLTYEGERIVLRDTPSMEGQLSTFAVLNYTDFVDKTPSECLVENARVVAWNLSQVILLTMPPLADFRAGYNATLTCTEGPEISEVDYICLRVEGGFLRGEFRSTPCPRTNEFTFNQQGGTGLIMYGNRPLCSRVDTGALIAGNPDNDCYPNYGVFMYPSIPANEPESNGTESNGTNLLMATVLSSSNQTQKPIRVAKWRIDPQTNTVHLEVDPENSLVASTLYREIEAPLWPGALGWKQKVPQGDYVGLDSGPVFVETVETNSEPSNGAEIVYTVEYAAPGFTFFFSGDEYQAFVQKRAWDVFSNQTNAPTFTRVVHAPTIPKIDREFYNNRVDSAAAFATGVLDIEGACVDETLHQHTTLFFSSKTCAEAYAHAHWRFFSRNTSGYCTNDFTPRIQNGAFDCIAREANGGEDALVNGYFRLDNLAYNFSSYLVPKGLNLSTIGFDIYVPAIAHFPGAQIEQSTDELECGYAFPDQFITYKTMNLSMQVNFTEMLPQICEAYSKRSISQQGGWIGTRLVAGNVCDGLWPSFPSVHETFSTTSVSDLEVFGGSMHALHTWPSPAHLNNQEFSVTYNQGLRLCVERYEKAKDVLEEMTWFANYFIENSIRTSWIFARPEDYFNLTNRCTNYNYRHKIPCPFALPAEMAAFSRVSSVQRVSNLVCNEVTFNGEGSPRCYGTFQLELNAPEISIKRTVGALMLGLDPNKDYIDKTNMAAFRRGYQAYILSPDGTDLSDSNYLVRALDVDGWLIYRNVTSCVEKGESDIPGAPDPCTKYKPISYGYYDKGTMWNEYKKYGGKDKTKQDRLHKRSNRPIRALLFDLLGLDTPNCAKDDYIARESGSGVRTRKREPPLECAAIKYLYFDSSHPEKKMKYDYDKLKIHARFEYKLLFA